MTYKEEKVCTNYLTVSKYADHYFRHGFRFALLEVFAISLLSKTQNHHVFIIDSVFFQGKKS